MPRLKAVEACEVGPPWICTAGTGRGWRRWGRTRQAGPGCEAARADGQPAALVPPLQQPAAPLPCGQLTLTSSGGRVPGGASKSCRGVWQAAGENLEPRIIASDAWESPSGIRYTARAWRCLPNGIPTHTDLVGRQSHGTPTPTHLVGRQVEVHVGGQPALCGILHGPRRRQVASVDLRGCGSARKEGCIDYEPQVGATRRQQLGVAARLKAGSLPAWQGG